MIKIFFLVLIFLLTQYQLIHFFGSNTCLSSLPVAQTIGSSNFLEYIRLVEKDCPPLQLSKTVKEDDMQTLLNVNSCLVCNTVKLSSDFV